LKINVAIDRGSISQYARLFLGSVLPADYHRVLYLDCDLIVNQSIEGLLNIDLQGKTVGALKDAFSKEYRKNINLEPDDIMFNSGVMLIDLDRWRTQNIENKLLDYIRQKKGKIQQGDQGVLNYVLAHDIYCLEPKYNAVTIFFDFSYQEMLIYRKPPEGYYTETEIQEAVDNPVIIHYTTSFLSRRPWITGSKRKYHEVWDHFKTMSPWKDTEAWPYINRPGIRGIYIKLCRIMPRSLVIHLSGWLQAYVRPRKYRD
jgi:lipopolysaccharide biosynthesis glycosyltransferase